MPTIDELVAAARSRLDRLSPVDVRAEVDAGALIVDTRCGEARTANGLIPGSVHVPLSVLYWRLDPTSGHDEKALSDRHRQIILVCADGYSRAWPRQPFGISGFHGRRILKVDSMPGPPRASSRARSVSIGT